ncbi:ABC transporter permease subunit [Prochlorococcus sp. MIT 1307]|uniref:ABC transporter permease subunit n=1 Tax=Prochlorococcus sp. MIT 1307 TaxID=3096219 RepID=UPI002A75FBE8|nr:ABC transporter permease subunit [Prochlorococcus sp. MIT 1307]
MRYSKKLTIQLLFAIAGLAILSVFISNLTVNLIRTGMGLNFNWLIQPSGFALSESSLPYKPSDNYLWVLFIGWINSLKVIIAGLILATIFGLIAGIARTSQNILLKKVSSLYVALIRQIPLLLQLMFWYFVVFLSLPESPIPILGSMVIISNQGIIFLGLNLSVEFSSLLIGLSIFSGASIAEVIRGGLNSISKGQWEAFRSLGISENLGMFRIVLPQALPAIIPGLTSQYLNLAKNSTLAIAVGYADLYAVSDTTITQTGRAIEGFIVLLVSFLLLNLIISGGMEVINRLTMKSNYHF